MEINLALACKVTVVVAILEEVWNFLLLWLCVKTAFNKIEMISFSSYHLSLKHLKHCSNKDKSENIEKQDLIQEDRILFFTLKILQALNCLLRGKFYKVHFSF